MILVTGATGFVGQHLVKRLQKENYSVKSLIMDKAELDDRHGNLEIVVGDIRNESVIKEAIKGVDKIIHLVSVHQAVEKDKKYIWEVNVTATVNLLNEAVRNRISHFIYCSTALAVHHTGSVPVNETAPYNFRKDDAYEMTKATAERIALRISRGENLPLTIIRPSMIYGEGDIKLLKLVQLINRRRFVFIGSGRNYFQPVYVTDVVECILRILKNEKSKGEIFIVAGEQRVTLQDFVLMIADELGASLPNLHLPSFPLFILAFICEKICSMLNVIPPLSRSRVRLFTESKRFDISKAKRILGFMPRIDLNTGIRDTIKWYKENGLIKS